MISKFWKKYEKEIIIRGNKMNIIDSCIDRHVEQNPNKIAFSFEDDKGKIKKYSYLEASKEINKFANYLEKIKVKKGSRVFLFLPKCPEMYLFSLAVIKQGSICCPLFEAFQTDGLELRLKRGDADVLITNKELVKRLKNKKKFRNLKTIVVNKFLFKRKLKRQSENFESVMKNKNDTATMIFTSSTAGTPVAGIEISHYALVQQHYTAELVLDLKKEDNYWCTAHPGWVTGTIYGIIAPLSIGCSTYIIEGRFDAEKWIDFVKKNNISVIYTAPTALRMLKNYIKKSDFKKVRNICSVGEALTKTIFEHYKKITGLEINDTFWQTETGAMVICSWPKLKKNKEAIGKAIPGITAKIIDGTIAIKPDFPSLMTGIYKHKKMYNEYFSKGWFRTNDMARKDSSGYFYFMGRKDDMIKTSGERVSPIEIESILIKHKAVKEAGVIGIPDKMKGAIIKAFVVLNKNFNEDEKLKKEIGIFVKKNYAGHSYPKEIEFVKELPKTNSGKIIRMKLREEKG